MKRIISITIALCLVFCSVLPVYAEAWTSSQASQTTLNVQNIYQYLRDFLLSYNSGQTSDWTFGDLYWEIRRIGSWIAPIGSNDGTYETLWSILMNIAIDTRSYLPSIPNIASFVSSWMTSNNNYLNSLDQALTNYYLGSTWNVSTARLNAHRNMTGGIDSGTYQVPRILGPGSIGSQTYTWREGSPIGNIAAMLQRDLQLNADMWSYRWTADLTHYNDNLTTWDSQGSTLTQVAFTPDSAIQGLYRYLAFTQRDVARLAYVFANDEELEARELAQANQEQVLDDFIDPAGTGAVSTTDLGSMADASGSFKDNFDTGQSASGIWNVFDRDYDWFSQTTADNLQPSLTRSAEEYSTPYLDEYYKELDSTLEVNKRD